MRVICLDVGQKRIGVAVTDALNLTAQGVETIWRKNRQSDLERILTLCREYQTDRVLCGLPRNMDGSEGFQAERSREYGAHLTEAGLNVRFWDERMTTKLARDVLLQGDVRREKRKETIDKLAATYILQSFMDAGGWKEIPEKPEKKTLIGGIYRMNENLEMPFDPEQENIVELVDEEGQAVTFEHLMSFEHKGKVYICLVPVEPVNDMDEDELVIMRTEYDDEGIEIYTTIDSDEELNEAYEKYLEIAEADEDEE